MRKANEILRELLKLRGISSNEDISEFLSEMPKRTYDPFLLLNMKAGVDLILSEAKAGTKICVYGDYDADGVTSVCIMLRMLGNLTDNLIHYIPSRFDEGYGLNSEAVRKLAEEGVGLLITVDCGSVSCSEVELAKELGMKVIVTDHHSIDDVKADCILINPRQSECKYPFKGLAGCGVAFKMAQAIQQTAGLPKAALNDLLDLVAVGTVGDVMPLVDENRTMVKYGLNKINAASRISMKKLAEGISIKWVTSENIAFGIAPHINAAGRIADAEEAVKLFMTEDLDIIERQVDKLIEYNGMRKQYQESAYKKGSDIIERDFADKDFMLLRMDDIHEGIAGIVAGKLKDMYNRPTAIVTPTKEGFLKGTGRSIENVDIYALLKRNSALFEKFGGHRSACGFTVREELEDELRDSLNREMESLKGDDPDIFHREIKWDMEIRPDEVSEELVKDIERMGPFGEMNPRPCFVIRNVIIANVRFMGNDMTHARFTGISQEGGRIECVLFKRAQEYKDILSCPERSADIKGNLELQVWKGIKKLKFIVEEIIS